MSIFKSCPTESPREDVAFGLVLSGSCDVSHSRQFLGPIAAVRPDMQGKGVNALLFTELIPQFKANGYKYVESNNELETNHKVSNLWGDFDKQLHKRRCTFIKEL